MRKKGERGEWFEKVDSLVKARERENIALWGRLESRVVLM